MGLPLELPPSLRDRALTRNVLIAHGVNPQRLRGAHMRPLGSGVYVPRHLAERLEPQSLHLLKARAIVAETPGARLSHTTAALLHGFWLPARLSRDPTVHLTYPSESGRLVRNGVTSHRRVVRPEDVQQHEGIDVSSPLRTWLELAPLCTTQELVVLGDQLIRQPYARYEGRHRPYATQGELRETLDTTRRFPGRRRAVEALGLVRCGADSPPETLLRLALVEAGLPEPELQIPLHEDGSGRRADMGYRQARIVIQYEGAGHFDADQLRADQRRDNEFFAAGWVVLRFNAEDLRDGFRRAVTLVRQALAARR